jgi:Restriction endonuclease/AF1548-like, C-terminal
MIYSNLKIYQPSAKYQIDLRRSLSLMRSKPDLELFVGMLLKEHGYTVTMNQIVRGKCGEHEIDAIVEKDGKIIIVEVKHHFDYHKRTGLDIGRISWAILMDLIEGYDLGTAKLKVDKAMVICNTKFSDHATDYATCRGIDHIGWGGFPKDHDIQSLIEAKKLYPLTLLKNIKTEVRDKSSSFDIITLKQLISEDVHTITRKTGMRKETLDVLAEQAKSILY